MNAQRRQSGGARVRGFTLVEVMVATGVLVLLLAACLTALMYAFSTATRTHVHADRLRTLMRVTARFQSAVEGATTARLTGGDYLVLVLDESTAGSAGLPPGIAKKISSGSQEALADDTLAQIPGWRSAAQGWAARTGGWLPPGLARGSSGRIVQLGIFFTADQDDGRTALYYTQGGNAPPERLAVGLTDATPFEVDGRSVRLRTNVTDAQGSYPLDVYSLLSGPVSTEELVVN